jgi:hypothetical protein
MKQFLFRDVFETNVTVLQRIISDFKQSFANFDKKLLDLKLLLHFEKNCH